MIKEYFADGNFEGLAVGLATFLIIGVFHPIVIKSEYYFGVRCWWCFLIAGIALCVASIFTEGGMFADCQRYAKK